jgi:hypothetical protein
MVAFSFAGVKMGPFGKAFGDHFSKVVPFFQWSKMRGVGAALTAKNTTLGRCVPQLQGLVVAQKPQEFGPFWDLDRWEVSLQDQQLVAADLVGKASRNMGTSLCATRLVGDQNHRSSA